MKLFTKTLVVLSFSISAFAADYLTPSSVPVIYPATQTGGDDIVSFGMQSGHLIAWEIVRGNGTVFLNYSRFPYGSNKDKATVCYTNFQGVKYVSVGDSKTHLIEATTLVVSRSSGNTFVAASLNCSVHSNLIGKIPGAVTVQGLMLYMP